MSVDRDERVSFWGGMVYTAAATTNVVLAVMWHPLLFFAIIAAVVLGLIAIRLLGQWHIIKINNAAIRIKK